MYPVIKRLLDLTFSLFFLLLLSPLMIFLALYIKRDSDGPVYYKGDRVGKGGKMFKMLKFRTMVVNADKIGGSSTADDDPRITKAGKLMRKLKFDELPQFINVLKGEMSFVGPRPQVKWAVDLYTPEEQNLLKVRPGITDYASIKFRNEGEILQGSTDPDKDYMEKIAPLKTRLGLYYVETSSLWSDIKIVLATASGVFFGVNPDWCLPAFAQVPIEPVTPKSATSETSAEPPKEVVKKNK